MLVELLKREKQSFIFLVFYFAVITQQYLTNNLINDNISIATTIVLAFLIGWEIKDIVKQIIKLKSEKKE